VEYVVLWQQFCDQTGQTSWRLFRIIQGCSLHHLVLDRNKREIRSYSNSGYGDGISISFDDIDAMWLKASSEERMVAGVANSNEDDEDHHLTCEDNTKHPKKPGYLITLQKETTQSKDKALHPFESHSSRMKKAKTTKRAANLKQINDNHGAKMAKTVENDILLLRGSQG